ncbi:heparinase II/III family protein [Arenimonas daejeonensis]|uniref:heparinase II/III family protein n=1 Tax=Arenimonas daejeonensis TaxID=370777 RepID=UPI00131531D1|nr:heparinase II/III family protein [Arenimonas daejeonensis]
MDLLADWRANPFGHRSWQWHTASFNFMPWLIALDAAGEPAAMRRALEAVRSWSAAFPTADSDYEFAWHDHATSTRALNVLWLLCHLRMDGREPEAQQMLESFLSRHAERLMEEGMYSRHTNHGIDQSRVLALLGASLANGAEWRARAMTRLADELAFAFGPDGVHVENSPTYHQFVSNLFTEVAASFDRDQLGPLGASLDEVLPRALDYMAWIVRPDGLMPTLGDSEQRRANNVYRSLEGTPGHARLDWVLSGGNEGEKPAGWVRAFEAGGYLVARSDWSAADAPADAFHMVLRCGFRSGYHRHDDDLSICLYWGGDWLLDPGMHNYVEESPVRRYLRSKWAHNVPVPEGFGPDWSRPASNADGGLKLVAGDDDRARAEAWTASYPGMSARRCLDIDLAARRFEVEDRLESASATGGQHLFKSLWHLPADKQVSIGDRQVRILDVVQGRELRIDVLEGDCERIVLEDPGIEGQQGAVASREVNSLEPAQVLSFQFRGAVLHSRLGFRMIDHRADQRLGGSDPGRALFESYCREPAQWWPPLAKRGMERICKSRDAHLQRLGLDAAGLAEELYATAVLRKRKRRPTIYLTGLGGAAAARLETLLVQGAGMIGAGWTQMPAPLVKRVMALDARHRAIIVDAIHLLNSQAEPTDVLHASAVSTEAIVQADLYFTPEPGCVKVLLCGDPVLYCLSQSAAGVQVPSGKELEHAVARAERALRWSQRQQFDLGYTPQQVLDAPGEVVAAICRASGTPLDTDRLERALRRQARHASAAGIASRSDFPAALVSRLEDRFAPFAGLWPRD